MTAPIRLLIADDHPVYRDGLASLLDPLPEIEVVARASDGAEAVALAAEHRPDVVVTDVRMPPGFSDEEIGRASCRERV